MIKKDFSILFIVTALWGAVTINSLSSCSKNNGNSYVDDLMSKLTLEEKIGQLNLPVGGDIQSGVVLGPQLDSLILEGKIGGFFNVKGVEEISRLQHLAVEKGPHGIPLLVGADVVHGYETIFPIPLALSCSWDSVAVERMARISAIEATADGVNWNFSPMVDICRDPRWGRIAEGSGEDPYLGSVMAKAYVRGYQGDDMKSDSTLLACVKHFALYGAAEGGRDYNTVDMSKERMFNYYLPPFQAAVDAGVGSLMTSFNLVNGQHSTASKWLLDGVLRADWSFNGLVVTDYNSVPEVSTMGTAAIEDAAANSLNAGTDMDMVSGLYVKTLADAVKRGLVKEKTIDDACRRVLKVKQELGLFEDPYKYCNVERSKKDIFTPEHRAQARSIAAETFVLLRNDNNTLPLKKKGKIALIGPLADAANNMCGCWSMLAKTENHESLLTAFRRAVGDEAEILYAKGSNIYYDETTQRNATGLRGIEYVKDDNSLRAEALTVANRADVIVAAIGESSDMSGESASRTDITIPDTQRDLLKALVKTGKPVVLLLFTGRPLVLDWESDNVPAILNVWFGGSEAGDAITDVVFGDKSPQGKLTTTFPRSVGQVPLYYNHLMSSHPDPQEGVFNRYCSNYIDCSNEPLYPFGYGLSYTSFEYGKPTLSSTTLEKGGTLALSVDVRNTGDRDGVETVQFYLRDPIAGIARPVKELKGYQRVYIPKGETKRVVFTVNEEKLKYYNSDLEYLYEPGEFYVLVGPDSRSLQVLTFIAK